MLENGRDVAWQVMWHETPGEKAAQCSAQLKLMTDWLVI
jgi:hypothetical protein